MLTEKFGIREIRNTTTGFLIRLISSKIQPLALRKEAFDLALDISIPFT